MSTKAELACVYASLILVDDDVAVTGEKISTILKAANSSGGSCPCWREAAPAAEAKKEEKKESEPEESDDDLGFALFE
uniref:60S acidic ribosomal protein P1 n=1 Tax=Glossina austeni TaxID=7395 RepID=A0A1A9VHZ4_GLOAU